MSRSKARWGMTLGLAALASLALVGCTDRGSVVSNEYAVEDVLNYGITGVYNPKGDEYHLNGAWSGLKVLLESTGKDIQFFKDFDKDATDEEREELLIHLGWSSFELEKEVTPSDLVVAVNTYLKYSDLDIYDYLKFDGTALKTGVDDIYVNKPISLGLLKDLPDGITLIYNLEGYKAVSLTEDEGDTDDTGEVTEDLLSGELRKVEDTVTLDRGIVDDTYYAYSLNLILVDDAGFVINATYKNYQILDKEPPKLIEEDRKELDGVVYLKLVTEGFDYEFKYRQKGTKEYTHVATSYAEDILFKKGTVLEVVVIDLAGNTLSYDHIID